MSAVFRVPVTVKLMAGVGVGARLVLQSPGEKTLSTCWGEDNVNTTAGLRRTQQSGEKHQLKGPQAERT